MNAHCVRNPRCTSPDSCIWKNNPTCEERARDPKPDGAHQITIEAAARANVLLAEAHAYRFEAKIYDEQARTMRKLEAEATDTAARKQAEACKLLLGTSPLDRLY